jgi:hypothetical protein
MERTTTNQTSYEIRGGGGNKLFLIIAIVLGIALLFAVKKCSDVHDINVVTRGALNDTVRYYQNKLGTVTAGKNTLQLDKKQLQDLLLKKDKEMAALASEFAKVHSVTKYSTKTVYDTIAVPFKDTVPCVFVRADKVREKWYGFNYKVNQKGFVIDSLTIPNTATVITGTKRKWFLGKETVTTDITNTNPYIKVTDITSAEVILPAPWYKKWWLWAAAGAVSGFMVAK